MMAKKRKKITKKIAENRKAKRVFLGLLIFIAVLCLGAAFSENLLRASVGIDGFESTYSEVPSKTRKALKAELEDFILLNTGKISRKAPKFVVRDGQALSIDEDEDGNKYSSFYIDSEELQLSALVQMNWGRSFSIPDTGFIVRIDCATENNIKFDGSHCYSRSTGEPARAIETENLGLLESYGATSEAVEEMKKSMLAYLKKAYPGATTALVDRASVTNNNGEIRAKMALDSKEFDLVLKGTDDWRIELRSGENIIWERSAEKRIVTERHYLALKKLLPVELETKSGTRLVMEYASKDRLVISSVSCTGSSKDIELEQAAKQWLKDNNFNAEAFEIKLKNRCEN